jgi:23S rRNA (uracil1939-C5)-methyltransferase
LFDIACEYAELQPCDNVYDLYTGLGSIALYIADKVGHVTGIEEIPEAIEDAHTNMVFNNIQNATFYAGDVKHLLNADFVEKHGRADVLITDPPRQGMHEEVVKTLLRLEVPRLVYISCNPATQARDLALLKEKYNVDAIQPVDMFPHTHHIESVARLTLKESL